MAPVLRILLLFFLLAVAAADLLHESCNRTRYPALCAGYLRPQPDSRSLAALSLERTRRTGNSTMLFANGFIKNFLAHADGRSTNAEYRVLDCVSDCAFALNISVVLVKQARVVFDVADRKKATVLVQQAIHYLIGAGCAERDWELSPALKFIAKRNKLYRKLLRIAIDLINTLKK